MPLQSERAFAVRVWPEDTFSNSQAHLYADWTLLSAFFFAPLKISMMTVMTRNVKAYYLGKIRILSICRLLK